MKRIFIFVIILVFVRVASPAYAFWIWTPKTGKWVNPKTAVKETPKAQLEFAQGFYEGKKYEEAKREFKKLLKNYPKSAQAAESQYYLGLIDEAEGNLYEAYQSYQKVVDKYPFSARIAEINEREYKIAESFLAGEKRKTMGVVLPVENPAIEIFSKVVENSTYGPLAPKAQYKLGVVLKSLMRYYEAEEAFTRVVTNYPDSEWAEAAKFQIASCRANLSRSPAYDQGATQEAKEKFQEFIKEHPDVALTQEAEKQLEDLREKEAESSYGIGRFYEKQKDYEAAKIYYNDVISKHSNSIWAARSFDRLQVMEAKKK
ncbi:MAG: outer membrane protein assembly factor BamD [Candidatus Omnitrophica bacterium]|nr:outer membrane protein assembly factor BamD [Candidatus Omnitrophota bacterium]